MADDLSIQLINETKVLIEDFKIQLIKILKNDRKLKSDSRTLNSLKVFADEIGRYVSLHGTDYIYYVIHGRGPGRFPPPNPITGKWEIPFPVAQEIAKHGNKQKYLHVANAFEKAYDELVEKVRKRAGELSLAYILRLGTIRNVYTNS